MIQSEEFIKLLSADHYSRDDLNNVIDICRAYPMFNLAHMLKVRILESLDLEREKDLQLAAVYAGDRKRFYEFVMQPKNPLAHAAEEVLTKEGTTEEETAEEQVPEEGAAEDQIEEERSAEGLTSEEQVAEADAAEASSDDAWTNETHEGEKAEGDMNDLMFAYEEKSKADLIISSDDDQSLVGDQELLEIDPLEGSDEKESVLQVVEKQEAEMEEPEIEHDPIIPIDDALEIEDGPSSYVEVKLRVEKPKEDLIERFIKKEPGPIKADSETSLKGDASTESVGESDHLITDTLAKIYLKQGLHAKAIYAYEKLSLKFPEKSAYFAAQIDKIKNITN